MNRIVKRLGDLRGVHKKALIAFLTGGDPTFERSLEYLQKTAKAGADVLEIGMPFSDAMADGPVIQRSYERALKGGMSLARTLDLVAAFRKGSDVPILLMGYANPILRYGLPRFAKDLRASGGDGLLIVDLPPEESQEASRVCREHDLAQIFLLSPTTSAARRISVSRAATGFLYYIALEGVTGAALGEPARVADNLAAIRRLTDLPVAVGFGITSPAQAKAVAEFADAVVVGSALIRATEGKTAREAGTDLETLVRSLKRAIS